MKEFPFEAVFKHVAHGVMMKGLPKNDILKPYGLVIAIHEDGKLQPVPMPDISSFFVSSAGTAALGERVRELLQAVNLAESGFGIQETCVAIVSEAYARLGKREGMSKMSDDEAADYLRKERAKMPKSLKDDPESTEVVIVPIMTRTDTKVGFFPIKPDRTIEYKPMEAGQRIVGGNLSHKPNRKDEV